MSSIYVHIPLCKSRCSYCDFYSSTNQTNKELLLESICKEIQLRHDYLTAEPVNTIYFGGGTPSLLSPEEIGIVLKTIKESFPCDLKEVTIEVNPDDISSDYIRDITALSINRISMGIQSFRQEDLVRLNRRHTAQQAIDAVKICRAAGLNNISIDLMYGLPSQSVEQWKKNLEIAMGLNITHLSAYHLTYEEGTKLYSQKENGEIDPVNEDVSEQMFLMLRDITKENGFIHYEISNFSKPGMQSQHNSSYWNDIPYLGVGPSAHSYNGKSRQWNIANTAAYIHAIQNNLTFFELEQLTPDDKYNELIITSLRTCEGIPVDHITSSFGEKYLSHCLRNAEKFIQNGLLEFIDKKLRLTQKGIFVSDGIITDLLMIKQENGGM
jgi:oxygen-independent coproporphyrinogen-3 oxidase